MFVEMTCTCGASFQLDHDAADTMLLMFANKFTKAHESCGYMSPTTTDVEEKMKRYDVIYRERSNEPEEM